MWFKNLKVYQLTQDLSLHDDDLQNALSDLAFRPCGKQETATMGFCSPFSSVKGGSSPALFHRVGDRFWITLKKQERILPAAVVNAELAEKVEAIEAETGSPVGKKQQADLKQEIVHALLPRAFTKNSYTHACVSIEDSKVLVDASSDGKAETFLAMLRKALNSLPVVPLVRRSLQNELTSWISQAVPNTIELLEEAELKSSDDAASIVRCKNQPLDSEEIAHHIEAGKWVQKIAISYDDVMTAILCEDGSVKRIKFTDRIVESVSDVPKDDIMQRLDAEFALMSAELCQFINFLNKELSLTDDLT
ncbi:recombination-associated protein RdgC [Alteromonas sp. 5E99-2]|uniref:recombination-associated protein RdgC n=1 Tax=Alteromonas sp. 5E99-2 TaxID=2817683 RepID=UPI001A984249|nr:recombination-associated protein RdgC [Alteromonas sp. 5E99-2]MBO1254452.1 recombination-associated protein RdgC [Alteromonas sp. 5E99-2]